MNHNLPKYSHKKNNENISLLEKIRDKVYKENKESQQNSNSIKEKIKDVKTTNNIYKNNKKTEENNNNIQPIIKNEDILDKEIDEKDIKKESNDDEDDILSEEVDEMEESGKNAINSINKINSSDIPMENGNREQQSKKSLSL